MNWQKLKKFKLIIKIQKATSIRVCILRIDVAFYYEKLVFIKNTSSPKYRIVAQISEIR